MGLWLLPVLAIALAGFVTIDHRLPRARRPEYLVACAWALSVMMVSAACLMSGSLHSPALPWLAIPAVTLPSRFRVRGVAVGVLIIVCVMVAISLGLDWSATLRDPVPLAFDLALVASIVGFTLALMGSDLQHRGDAFIDPLTSMLNRHALAGRVAELAEQARVTRQPIALIMGDIDHFKAINDQHGHAVGDEVLSEAAHRMRVELRAYDLAYRLGGEEFLIVMPGADTRTAEEIAGTLRRAIEAAPIADANVTMSFGVSASGAGEFDYATLFALADKALYAAKNGGRNCVCVADDHGVRTSLTHLSRAPALVA
ncbi:MAG: GGDEF domain-containing protein [Solirubrobacteraceae bacterium]